MCHNFFAFLHGEMQQLARKLEAMMSCVTEKCVPELRPKCLPSDFFTRPRFFEILFAAELDFERTKYLT